MRKFFFISFFTFSLFIIGSISTLFIYPERSQKFIIESLNFKTFLNEKVKNYISRNINDVSINVDIEAINFLKPDWPNVAKIELNNVNIYSLKQKRKSKIKLIELGFSYNMLLKNFFLNENDIQLSYIKFKDLTLNAKIEKDKFLPGPLVKIFSLINQNNFQSQHSFKKILESKIVIGKINLLLINNVNLQEEKILEIACENVFISKNINNSRYLNMDCNERKNNFFSVKANLNKNSNKFSGKINNFNSNFLLDNWLNENFIFLKSSLYSELNGSYSIQTNKHFTIQNIKFVSDESNLILKNIENNKSLKTNFSGTLSWEKKTNLLQYSNVVVGDHLVASGEIDLLSQKGSSNFSIQKILVEDAKNYLKFFLNKYHFPSELNLNKISNKFRGGNFKNLRINLKFSLFEEFVVEEIIGSSNYSDIRFDYNDKIFKKLLSTISGNFDFRLKPKNIDESLFNVNVIGTDGIILINNKVQLEFNKAILSGQIYDNKLSISKAYFLKNSDLEYIFRNVRISKDTLTIGKAKYIKEKKAQYIFSNTIINNMEVTKSTLEIKYNEELSSYIKNKFDIDLIGNTNLVIILRGNLKNLNFNLKLNANLNNSYLKIHYLDLIKKKNIRSSFKAEILIINSKIVFFKNTQLSVDSKIYKIGLIEFNKKNTNNFLLKNLETPKINIDKIILSNNLDNLNIQAFGKKIDLSNLNKNLRSKINLNKIIILDLTANLIKLDSKISLTGNLKGEIKDDSFKSIAFGKMLLGGAPLLDNGKFEIYSDNKISRLKGLGLVGGAETKINLQKKMNNFPTLIFDTSNGGKLLQALGFTQNIKSGDMKININFLNNEYNDYEGRIISKKFSIINAPGIINSLSILSFSGIGSVITGEGVFFDKGKVNIKVKNNNFNFNKLYLTSESLGISARGNLNLEKNSIYMTGSVAPIKLISKILSLVPAVGELLTGLKKEGLFAGQFEMKGQMENPKVRLNTMSFAPGILRDLFSEDWLDNKNFFTNRSMD